MSSTDPRLTQATESSHLSDLGLMHNRVVVLVEMNQRLADERDHYKAALERIGDDRDRLDGYRGAGDFARATLRDFV